MANCGLGRCAAATSESGPRDALPHGPSRRVCTLCGSAVSTLASSRGVILRQAFNSAHLTLLHIERSAGFPDARPRPGRPNDDLSCRFCFSLFRKQSQLFHSMLSQGVCRGRQCACRASRGQASHCQPNRRALLAAPGVAAVLSVHTQGALAFEAPPPGFSRHSDRLDGYSFAYPESWITVTTSGNDVCYRNPRVADENLFVEVSSPSSSSYSSVADLGKPADASTRLRTQFLTEYMSTRLGVRREIQPLFAEARTGEARLSTWVVVRD